MKISLLGASFDVGNSVSVLAAGSIACILHTHPDAEISLLDYCTEGREIPFICHGETVSIRLVNIRFSKTFYLRNNIGRLIVAAALLKLIPSGNRGKLIRPNPWLRHIHEMDIVASIAGGDSFSDIYGLGRLLYVSLPQFLTILMGKKLVLLPQTIGPFKGRIAKAIARYILRHANAVFVRDRDGLRAVAALTSVNADVHKLRFCYDVGFALEPVAPAHVALRGLFPGKADGRCRVGLNVSGLLNMGGYRHGNMFGLCMDYRDLVCSVISFLIERKNATVLLVPHLFGNGTECDSPACEMVYDKLKERYSGRLGVITGDYNQSEIKYIIGHCDFFIGSRMHACIAAVSQGVPTVSIAYSDKFIGVMETVGLESLVADPRTMTEDEILAVISSAFDERFQHRARLEEEMPKVKRSVLELFADFNLGQSDS